MVNSTPARPPCPGRSEATAGTPASSSATSWRSHIDREARMPWTRTTVIGLTGAILARGEPERPPAPTHDHPVLNRTSPEDPDGVVLVSVPRSGPPDRRLHRIEDPWSTTPPTSPRTATSTS